MPAIKGGKRPDRQRRTFDDRRGKIVRCDVASVLLAERRLWRAAAQLEERSFSSWARRVMNEAANASVRNSTQHQEQAAAMGAGEQL